MNIFVNTLVMKNQTKYQKASKFQKARILNMLVEQTGMHRKSLIRKLNKAPSKNKRGGSKPIYTKDSIEILKLRNRNIIFNNATKRM